MTLLERYRAHRRRVLGIEDLKEDIAKLHMSMIEIRSLLGLTPDEFRQPEHHVHGKDPHGLG